MPLGKYVSIISIYSGRQAGRMMTADYSISNKKAKVREAFAVAFNEETADEFIVIYSQLQLKPHIFSHKVLLSHHEVIDDEN